MVRLNKVSLSTGSLPRMENCQFYELSSVFRMMKPFFQESKVDGFEFVLLPEWDSENPPLTPTSAPFECEKHTISEVADALMDKGFPILSVHANRDIGSYLCSEKDYEVDKGIRLVSECLDFTKRVGAKVCVFHFWDTWKESIDLAQLKAVYKKSERSCPDVEMSIENIPTRCQSKTPFQIVQDFRHKTLDLRWASMFNDFEKFAGIMAEVDDVHIQGMLQDGDMIPSAGSLNYAYALKQIVRRGYSGLFTVELEGKADYRDVLDYFVKLRKQLA